MKTINIKQRLRKDRPMVTISVRMPEDVIDDLKAVVPRLGFSGYQPLLRARGGQGLRRDLERLGGDVDLDEFIASRGCHGVDEGSG